MVDQSSTFHRVTKGIAILILMAAVLGILLLAGGSIVDRDTISYWAAGHLLIHHQNPYDAATVMGLEQSVGFKGSDPMVMRNPPYALFLVLPLGLFSPTVAGALWTIFTVGCFVASIAILRRTFGDASEPVPLWTCFFAPAIACIVMGQSSVIILFGLACFLTWYKTRPFMAGASLILVACKPHILLSFLLVLTMWVVVHRNYKIVAGVVSGLGVTLSLALWFDHSIIGEYLPTLRTANADNTSALASLLRHVTGINELQFALVIPASLWAAWYFVEHRREWSWQAQGLVLPIISLWAAPYSWAWDGVVMLPALLAAQCRAKDQHQSTRSFVWLNLAGLAVFGVHWTMSHFWTTTMWLGWFLWALHHSSLFAKNRGAVLKCQGKRNGFAHIQPA
jgi:hypothetical protein